MAPISRHRRAVRAGGGALLAAVAALTASAAPPSAAAPDPVPVQLLALNDLHGNLDPVPGAAGAVTVREPSGALRQVQAGGLPQVATLMERVRREDALSLVVAAGDMIGGSPLLSAAYHDEPTIDALEEVGLAVSSVGNHEFDEGRAELMRIADGGCHPEDGCAEPDRPYDGADFPLLAANVVADGAEAPLLPPYWVKRLADGRRIGFVGLTTRDTPENVSAAGVRGLTFADEVPVVDHYARKLEEQGVHAVVLLLHEGGHRTGRTYDADCDAEGPGAALSGRIKEIARRVTPQVDVIVSGHSHEPYVCTVTDPAGQPRVVTQAASFGRTFTELNFALEPATGDVVRSSVRARNHVVPASTPRHPAVRKVVEQWRGQSAELSARPVGYVSGDLPGRGASEPETPLGDLITDTQVAATRSADAQLALLNPGGLRADLVYRARGGEGDGVVTYGEAFQVQPFDNRLVTMTLTGDQLLGVLRQQFSGANEAEPIVLQLSDGLRYAVDMANDGAARLLADTVRVSGDPVRRDVEYRVTVNAFLADGGNGFTLFREGTERVNGTTDLEAFTDYLKANSSPERPLATPKADRIDFR